MTEPLFATAEEREEKQEHVEYVEEDRRGEEWRGADVVLEPQSLKVVHRETSEDHETSNCVDEFSVRDLDEHEREFEPNEGNQSLEERSRQCRQVTSRRIAGGTGAGDE